MVPNCAIGLRMPRTCRRDFPIVYAFCLYAVTMSSLGAAGERWPIERANEWYSSQPFLVGCNFVPSTAINQLEMWQADTFDPETIDRELGWAAAIGMNSVRVFLHDLAWRNDTTGFYDRLDQFLSICDKHKIRPMIVFFDGVWDPDPLAGRQRSPRVGVHNSGWVQSPGRVVLADPVKQDDLQSYVQGVIGRYKDDTRVLAWDLFNEPDNRNDSSYGPLELEDKDDVAAALVSKSFAWARNLHPRQPLTVCVWGDVRQPDKLSRCSRIALAESDILTFHSYGGREAILEIVQQLQQLQRPVLCTEFLARGNGCTWDVALPVFVENHVGCYCWGLVEGKTNTKFPWHTWQMPELGEPNPWHHDMLHTDGRPYSQTEIDLIRRMTVE